MQLAEMKLKCTECSETRSSDAPLAAHMKCHKEPGMHACDNCSYKSNEKSHLRNHLKHTRHTGTFKEYFCTNCRIEFESEEEEKRHKETHNQQGHIFECPICGYKGKTKDIIEQHMTCHDGEEEDSEFTCQDCAFQAMNRDQLIVHLGTTHDKHTCIFCNMICNGRNELNNHIKDSHKSNTQNKHILFANSNLFVKCYTCDTEFSNQDDLKRHIKEEHKTYRPCPKFQRSQCDYDDECDLRHIVLNQGEHICFKCGIIETSKTELFKHITKKHGDIPCHKFQTNQCDFGSSKCMFSHKVNKHKKGQHELIPHQDFQNRRQITAPPETNLHQWQGSHQKNPVNQDIMALMTQMQRCLTTIQKQMMSQ